MDLIHTTDVKSAISIIKNGFVSDAIDLDRCASFEDEHHLNSNQYSGNGCQMHFQWVGCEPVNSDITTYEMEDEVIYLQHYDTYPRIFWRYAVVATRSNLIFRRAEILPGENDTLRLRDSRSALQRLNPFSQRPMLATAFFEQQRNRAIPVIRTVRSR